MFLPIGIQPAEGDNFDKEMSVFAETAAKQVEGIVQQEEQMNFKFAEVRGLLFALPLTRCRCPSFMAATPRTVALKNFSASSAHFYRSLRYTLVTIRGTNVWYRKLERRTPRPANSRGRRKNDYDKR